MLAEKFLKEVRMHTHIRWKRARTTVQLAIEAYRKREYPYQNQFLPQDILPPDIRQNPLLTARILFYSCHYMRGTIKSDYAMRCMVRLYREHPHFFDPGIIKDAPLEEIRETLGALLPYKVTEVALSWKENSRRLFLHWHGDPRNIFSVAKCPEDMYRFVTNRNSVRAKGRSGLLMEDGFLGFQNKMASMLAYFLESCRLIEPFQREAIPPVDFHHLRVLIATGSIAPPSNNGKARYEKLRPIGEYLYARLMPRMNIRMRELGDALWIISNRLCSKSPVTQTLYGELLEPDWGNVETIRAYEKTCGSCPLHTLCERTVRADVYYQQGHFELDQVRPRPPLQTDLLYESPRVFSTAKKKSSGH